jgi:hypothetical protein
MVHLSALVLQVVFAAALAASGVERAIHELVYLLAGASRARHRRARVCSAGQTVSGARVSRRG